MLKPYYEISEGRIYHGHALDVLREMPSESVQMCVTSPPYWGLRDYGLPPMIWDAQEGCEHGWGDEVGQVQQAGHSEKSTLAGFTNPNTKERQMAQQEKASQGQFCQLCTAWRGCLGLEPTPELYIKHMVQIFSELRRVLRSDGTLWLNMGDSYNSGTQFNHHSGGFGDANRYSEGSGRGDWPGHRKLVATMKTKDLCGIPWILAFALRADGWYLRSDIIWHKSNPMPESATDRPTKAHEYLFLLTKSAKYFYDSEAIKDPQEEYERNRRLREKSQGLNSTYDIASEGKTGQTPQSGTGAVKSVKRRHELAEAGTRNKRTVWTIATQPMPEAHFATFPEKLIEPCILAGTSERGCCVECGAGWIRVMEKGEKIVPRERLNTQPIEQRDTRDKGWNQEKGFNSGTTYESKTIGWKPSCKCYGTESLPEYPEIDKDENDEYKKLFEIQRIEPVRLRRQTMLDSWKPLKTKPCTALDPFGGSMTTAIVAHKYGRKFIMIELSKSYIDEIGIPRIKKATKQKGWNRFK